MAVRDLIGGYDGVVRNVIRELGEGYAGRTTSPKSTPPRPVFGVHPPKAKKELETTSKTIYESKKNDSFYLTY